MTVAELIRALHAENPEALVVLAKDAGGNAYAPVSTLWRGHYAAHSGWSGEMGLAVLTEEDRQQGYSEEDIVVGVPAVCLTPVH